MEGHSEGRPAGVVAAVLIGRWAACVGDGGRGEYGVYTERQRDPAEEGRCESEGDRLRERFTSTRYIIMPERRP